MVIPPPACFSLDRIPIAPPVGVTIKEQSAPHLHLLEAVALGAPVLGIQCHPTMVQVPKGAAARMVPQRLRFPAAVCLVPTTEPHRLDLDLPVQHHLVPVLAMARMPLVLTTESHRLVRDLLVHHRQVPVLAMARISLVLTTKFHRLVRDLLVHHRQVPVLAMARMPLVLTTESHHLDLDLLVHHHLVPVLAMARMPLVLTTESHRPVRDLLVQRHPAQVLSLAMTAHQKIKQVEVPPARVQLIRRRLLAYRRLQHPAAVQTVKQPLQHHP